VREPGIVRKRFQQEQDVNRMWKSPVSHAARHDARRHAVILVSLGAAAIFAALVLALATVPDAAWPAAGWTIPDVMTPLMIVVAVLAGAWLAVEVTHHRKR